MPLSWIVLVCKSLCYRPNIITEYQIVFLRAKFFEFKAVIMKETLFTILMENIAPFSSVTKEFSLLFRKLNLQTDC